MNSDFETVLPCRFISWLHWTTLNVASNTVTIEVIIVTHALIVCWIIIFSLVFHKAKEECIIIISMFLFKFDVQNVLTQRIQNRINKYFIPIIKQFFCELVNRIINFDYFHLRRFIINGIYQSNLWFLDCWKKNMLLRFWIISLAILLGSSNEKHYSASF